MKKINIIGNIFGTDGYSIHTRKLANALYKLTPDIRIDTPKQVGWESQVNDAELNMLTKDFDKESTTIMIGTPQYWRLGIMQYPKKFIGFLVWEGDKIPKYWLNHIFDERVDQIFVPSQHTKDAIFNTMDKEIGDFNINKIHVIPHGVDFVNFFKKESENKKEKFTFICNKGWRGDTEDRGGVQYLLKAFNEEFDKDEKVELVIKLNPAYAPQDIQGAVNNLGVEPKGNIRITADNVPYESLVNFYNQGDVFVCPTRAEAFNIPGLEALACGLPVIQTGFGGQTDYMKPCNSFDIGYELVEVKHDMQYEGIKWATPDHDELKKILRWSFENQHIIKSMSEKCQNSIKDFTWDNSAKKIIEIIKK